MSRHERREEARVRRNRLLLVISVVVSAMIVVAWFPVSDLLHQRQQLAAASAQLHAIDQQNGALAREAKKLRTPAEIAHVAQQQYNLVMPGQQAYQVLPPSGSGNGVGLGTTSTAGTTGGSSPARSTTRQGTSSTSGGSGSFVHRIIDTLEFWR